MDDEVVENTYVYNNLTCTKFIRFVPTENENLSNLGQVLKSKFSLFKPSTRTCALRFSRK